MKLIENVLAFF